MKLQLAVVLLSILAFMSCKPNNKKEGAENKLTIGVMSSMDYLPLAIAQERGYFTDNGIEVDIQKFFSANDRDAALQSNNLDGTIIDYTGGAIQAAGGIPLQFTSQCDGTFEMIVSKDSDISNAYELKGRKIATSRNTVIDYCTDYVLISTKTGVDNIERVEINKIPLRLEMLNNNKIDATMLPDPFATIAKNYGNRSVTSMDSIYLKVTGIVFRQEVIDEKKETLKKLYKAYNQAVKDLQTEPASSFEDILIKEIGFPPALVSKAILPKYTEAQLPNQNDLATTQVWLQEKGLIPSDFDISSIIATGVLD